MSWEISSHSAFTNGVVLVSLLLTLFTPCSSVSTVNFEHVIADWDDKNLCEEELHDYYTT